MRGREYKGKTSVYRKVLRANAGDNVHPAQGEFELGYMIGQALLKTKTKLEPYCKFPEAMNDLSYYETRSGECLKRGEEWEIPEGGISSKEMGYVKKGLTRQG